jgi:ubiquinone/menaquinone biosynthesis C-methylase UbiE
MIDYLDRQHDWMDARLVSAFDHVSLWSAQIGALLLREIPLPRDAKLLDVGCGTGFPLIELSQRLGPSCRAVGIDRSKTACDRAREKIRMHGLQNIQVVEGDAAAMPFADGEFNLICSNLGINNFSDAPKALAECGRVSQPGAIIALTSNLQGHMQAFYDVFEATLRELGRAELIERLLTHIGHRATIDSIRSLLHCGGFSIQTVQSSEIRLRFLDGSSLLRHFAMNPAFVPAWREIVKREEESQVFTRLEQNLNTVAQAKGELALDVPIAYVQAVKV